MSATRTGERIQELSQGGIMKVFRSKFLGGTFSALVLAGAMLAQSSQAAPSAPPSPSEFHHHGFRGRGFGGPMLGRYFHQLGLSDAQKAQIKQIMTQERPALKPLMQQM